MSGLMIIFMGALATLVPLALVVSAGQGTPARLRKRAVAVHGRVAHAGRAVAVGPKTSLKRTEAKGLPILEGLAKRFVPRQALLRRRLERTGRQISIGTYALFNLAVALLVAGVMIGGFGLPVAMAAAVSVAAGLALPYMAVGMMAGRRLKQFTGVFPDAIDLMVRGLRSGLPVTESIAAVGREFQGPVGEEFRRITDAVKFGQTLEEVMWDTAKRLDTAEFKFFVISLAVQRETGGNLAETLANLSDILRKRRQMRLKIKAISSEARASAMILGALPFVMFTLIYLINPGYESELFFDPRGRMMLGGALVTMGVGILVMAKMVRFEI